MSPQGASEGMLDVLNASGFAVIHPEAFLDLNGRAVRATRQSGFLSFGQYKTGYPEQDLEAVFYLYIDNNTYDNTYICILDVVEARTRVVAQRVMTRQSFPEAGKHVKLAVPFRPASPQAEYEFRVFYIGYAYLAIDGVIVIDPARVTLDQLPDRIAEESPERYCQGNELLCLERFAPDLIAQQHGVEHGGSYDQGTFTPADKGGIEFPVSIDLSRHVLIELELEGNIANAHLAELEGGKVSLFDTKEQGGAYILSFQRMYAGYRGTGIFRIMHGFEGNNVARVITTAQLSGAYSMQHWGNEPHTLRVEVEGARCRLSIDQFVSKWDTSRQSIGGTRQLVLMLGNRVERHSHQQAITKFRRLKITYL